MPPFDPLLGLEYPAVLSREPVHRILLTRPPYRCYGEGRLLVVAVRRNPSDIELVLAYERYPRRPRDIADHRKSDGEK